MPNNKYVITYDQVDNVEFPSKGGMQKYLKDEHELWAPFLTYLVDKLGERLSEVPLDL